MPETEERPHLQILTPTATREEIAAVVAVLSAVGSPAPVAEPERSLWSSPRRAARAPLQAGRGSWRASGLPG